jgi:hypothetical protein
VRKSHHVLTDFGNILRYWREQGLAGRKLSLFDETPIALQASSGILSEDYSYSHIPSVFDGIQ